MAYIVYVLYSSTHDRLYIGQTEDINRRLEQHHNGGVFSTKSYEPMKLVYKEQAATRADAMKREKQLKTTSGRKWIRKNCL